MPLQGDLKEFGVPEMLQLLEQQGKSGCLQIQSDAVDLEVYFQEGRILGAFEAHKDPGEQILDSLTTLGFLTHQEQENILKQLRRDLHSLPEVLRQHGILEIREFEILLRERIEELLYSTFQRHKGTFSFVQGKRMGSEWALQEALPVEPLILEGLRRTDEWPLLRKRVGSLNRVPQRKLRLAEPGRARWRERFLNLFSRRGGGAQNAVRRGEAGAELQEEGEDSLTTAEKHLYRLVDGKRGVGQIVADSRLAEYTACRAFLSLLEMGWVQMPAEEVPCEKEGSAVAAGTRRLAGAWLLIAGLIALLLGFRSYMDIDRLSWVEGPFLQGAAKVTRLLNNQQRERIKAAIEIYRKDHGGPPRALAGLLDENLLQPHDLSLWGNNRFSYEADSAGGYRLLIMPRGNE